jgi:hypothetical protein
MARVPLIGPDGDKYSVEAAEVDQAVKAGYKIANPTGYGESAVRGAAQGATLGWSDELEGAYRALASNPADKLYALLHPEEGFKAASAGDAYRGARDEAQAANAVAHASNPKTYTGAEMAGTVATDLGAVALTGGAALPALAAGQGAIQGAGYSDADLTRGQFGALAGDAGLGAGLGLAGYGLGTAVGAGGRKVLAKARGKLSAADAKAAAQATKEVEKEIASARGSYGAARQDESRMIENLMRLESEGNLTPANRAALDALKKGPEWARAQNQLAGNTLRDVPGTMSEVDAKRLLYEGLAQQRAAAEAARTAELLQPTAAPDVKSFLKSYGEPVAGAILGGVVGDQFDSPKLGATLGTAGGLIAGRTRAGKALMTRIEKPGNQKAIWSLIEGAAEKAGNPQMGRYADILRRASTRGQDAIAASHFLLYNNDPAYRQGLEDHAAALEAAPGSE